MTTTVQVNNKQVSYICPSCCALLYACESKACGRCFSVRYCGLECQESHWDEHKSFCVPISKRDRKKRRKVRFGVYNWFKLVCCDREIKKSIIKYQLERPEDMILVVYSYRDEPNAVGFAYMTDTKMSKSNLYLGIKDKGHGVTIILEVSASTL